MVQSWSSEAYTCLISVVHQNWHSEYCFSADRNSEVQWIRPGKQCMEHRRTTEGHCSCIKRRCRQYQFNVERQLFRKSRYSKEQCIDDWREPEDEHFRQGTRNEGRDVCNVQFSALKGRVVFHCWQWWLDNMLERLIAEAGMNYSTIVVQVVFWWRLVLSLFSPACSWAFYMRFSHVAAVEWENLTTSK